MSVAIESTSAEFDFHDPIQGAYEVKEKRNGSHE
jgi:hypothetical protein